MFNNIAKLPTDDIPPNLFYMSGIIAWNYFSSCLTLTSNTFTNNANIFGKVYFPRVIIPISVVISSLTKFLVQLIMFLSIYLYYILLGNTQVEISFYSFLFIPVMVFQMAILALGIGMIISSLTIKYRDLNYLLNFGTQLLMYISPIIFPLSLVPKKLKLFFLLNPITPIIEGFRYSFLGKGYFDYYLFAYSLLLTTIIFFLGLFLFNKAEKSFIDIV